MLVNAHYAAINKELDPATWTCYVQGHVIYLPFRQKIEDLFGVSHKAQKVVFSGFSSGQSITVNNAVLRRKCIRFDIRTGKQPEVDRHQPLCLINFFDYDVGWHKKLRYQSIIVYKDDESEQPYSVPNKAKSETNILKFIVDNYNNLPVSIISLHQYDEKALYMNGSLIDKVNGLTWHESMGGITGYLSLNDKYMGSVLPQINKMRLSGWWEETMKPWFGSILTQGDFTLGRKAGAQYVVSKENILSNSKEFYENMYDWLTTKTIDYVKQGSISENFTRENDITDSNPVSNWHTSRYMEWTWELIFTRKVGLMGLGRRKEKSAFYQSNGRIVDVSHRIPWPKTGTTSRLVFNRSQKIGTQVLGVRRVEPSSFIVIFNNEKRYIVFETDTVFQPVVITL